MTKSQSNSFDYFIGLLITGICVGVIYEAVHGWLVIGLGFLFISILSALLDYLNGTSDEPSIEKEETPFMKHCREVIEAEDFDYKGPGYDKHMEGVKREMDDAVYNRK